LVSKKVNTLNKSKNKLLYDKGNYNQMNEYFSKIDWDKEPIELKC